MPVYEVDNGILEKIRKKGDIPFWIFSLQQELK
jgi:hypothetical protein